ncbi:nucleotidyltransferase [bacterium]|nr:nucleotidyltransferase [bacterium]
MNRDHFSKDIQEFIKALNLYKVDCLIVGGEAVIYYGYARLTGDIDFFYDSAQANAGRLYSCLLDFWSGVIPGINDASELTEVGTIIQFGIPPNRIDLINTIDGITFTDAWQKKVKEIIVIDDEECSLYYISLDDLIINKRKIRRNKDLDDLKFLEYLKKSSGC